MTKCPRLCGIPQEKKRVLSTLQKQEMTTMHDTSYKKAVREDYLNVGL